VIVLNRWCGCHILDDVGLGLVCGAMVRGCFWLSCARVLLRRGGGRLGNGNSCAAVVHKGCDQNVRKPDVSQINDLRRTKLEWFRRVLHKRQEHFVPDA
jgi:hypothetical protein